MEPVRKVNESLAADYVAADGGACLAKGVVVNDAIRCQRHRNEGVMRRSGVTRCLRLPIRLGQQHGEDVRIVGTRHKNRRQRLCRGQIAAGFGDLGFAGNVCFCQKEHVGAVHLCRDDLSQLRIGALRRQIGGVDKDKRHARPEIRVNPREVHDPTRVGHAACLDQDVVDGIAVFHQCDHRVDQPSGERAADTAVRKLHDPGVGAFDQTPVDVEGAEVIHQHREASVLRLRQHIVQEARLAGAKKAADDCERHLLRHAGPSVIPAASRRHGIRRRKSCRQP